MAPATGFMVSLLPKLEEILNVEHKLQTSIKEDVVSFYGETYCLQFLVLKLTEGRRFQLDEQVNLWVKECRELSYYMEAVVDKLLVLAPSSEGFKGVMEKMGSLLKKGRTPHQACQGNEAPPGSSQICGQKYITRQAPARSCIPSSLDE